MTIKVKRKETINLNGIATINYFIGAQSLPGY